MSKEDKLKEIVSNVLEIPVSEIGTNFSSRSTDKWDSLNHMNLIVAIEEEFDIEIDEDDILDLMSYADLLSYLVKHNSSD